MNTSIIFATLARTSGSVTFLGMPWARRVRSTHARTWRRVKRSVPARFGVMQVRTRSEPKLAESGTGEPHHGCPEVSPTARSPGPPGAGSRGPRRGLRGSARPSRRQSGRRASHADRRGRWRTVQLPEPSDDAARLDLDPAEQLARGEGAVAPDDLDPERVCLGPPEPGWLGVRPGAADSASTSSISPIQNGSISAT
jgi:hypothetical protein